MIWQVKLRLRMQPDCEPMLLVRELTDEQLRSPGDIGEGDYFGPVPPFGVLRIDGARSRCDWFAKKVVTELDCGETQGGPEILELAREHGW